MNAHDEIERLMVSCQQRGGSDLHISSNWAAMIRVNGALEEESERQYSNHEVEQMVMAITNEARQAVFAKQGQIDFGYSDRTGQRYRINAYREMGKCTLAIRHLNNIFHSMEELRLPKKLDELVALKKGLVIMTGATGSGKSTTLATLIHEINKNRRCHIITIEDPVEFVHSNIRALVHQREVHADTDSFADAVRASLREDPDVIMVGEMRDLDTIKAAITAAETGHLVFSTLHTNDAVGAIERLVGAFPGDEQDVARNRLSMALQGVVAQQLIPTSNGRGRIPAIEILRVTTAIANMINAGKSRQIYSLMESGNNEGMQTIDQALAMLVKERWIAKDTAVRLAKNTLSLEQLIADGGANGR
ncbi:MAG: PilT/PilU family type 4a pilus ATPase [Cycloclasticus sp.]